MINDHRLIGTQGQPSNDGPVKQVRTHKAFVARRRDTVSQCEETVCDRKSGLILSRRRLLGATASGSLAGLAGCLGDSEETVPEPVTLDNGQACDQCNMQIDVHPGPVGQAYYLDEPPEDLPADRDHGRAQFCSAWCTYTYVLERAGRGTEPAGSYLTDYSAVAYRLYEEGGTSVISAHLGVDAFARAKALTYAVDSDVEGAMGASLIGFTSAADTEAFVAAHGGTRVEHQNITRQTVANL